MPPCLTLSIIIFNSYYSSVHLGVVAIEKEAFGSPSTKVANFTYVLFIYLFDCPKEMHPL